MSDVRFYIVDVFAVERYSGNQLVVFFKWIHNSRCGETKDCKKNELL